MTNKALAIALGFAIENAELSVLSVEPEYEWGANGRRTDEVVGTRYTCLLADWEYEKIEVITPELRSSITPKDFEQAKANGHHIPIGFEGLDINCYVNKQGKFVVYVVASKAVISK